MKLLISTIRICCLLVLALLTTKQGAAQFAPIQVNETPQVATCQLGSGGTVTLSVPTEALTGNNIPLRINLQGSSSSNCLTKVFITASSNLEFVSSAYPFQHVGNNVYETVNPFPSNDNPLFNVHFKFPGYVTCNGAVGTLDVRVEMDCDGQVTVCNKQVQVIARAGNYWTVEKEFVSGNLTCGTSLWKVNLWHNNPNPSGLGTYAIHGTVSESTGLPVVSPSIHTVNYALHYNGLKEKEFIVQNCVPEGSTITNAVDYDLVLGSVTNECGRMQGTVTAQSPPMISPNADLSFTKQMAGVAANLAPGCQGQYSITVSNNGNVPWTNIVVTDVLPVHIQPVNPPLFSPSGSWTWSLTGNTYTFSFGNNVLLPGQSTTIRITFTIDPLATPGSTITNTATVQYQAVGQGSSSSGSGGTGTPCPGVNCPEIDTSIHNKTDSVSFEVEQPRAIPHIRKCIVNPPNGSQPPIYQVGDVIRFRIKVGNSGAAPLSSVVSDALNTPNQNLQIIPSSVQYAYYTNVSVTGEMTNCNHQTVPEPNVPFQVIANTSDLQNPTFHLTNMPGNCLLQRATMLEITFDALVLPQMYGNNKLNTAVLSTPGHTNLQHSVQYSIDDKGYLEVNKRADQDYVENGQTFNYIIEINNLGSTGLHHITLTDALPGCVQRAGDIVVKNPLGNTVPYTITGNVQLTLSPTEQLAPGGTITVTIPVQKVSGATCCNVTASATARSVTTDEFLTSFSGTELEPAACVRSVECCDVQGFEAQLVQQNGRYYLHITGGAVPLQEVDVTMLDFHVEYSSPDCKPANMGVFGQLSTTANTLGGLLLSNGFMPAGSLSWGLGTPSVINGNAIELEITHPAILDIPCCEFELTFCIKVRVKDVNCNVCEKTICYTSEPTEPPCDLAGLELTSPGRICPGQTISFTWSGSSPSGGVEIYLVNAANPNNYHVIATGVSNGINSYTYTLPADFPCEGNQQWYIVIKDPKSDCMISSKRFTITCCEPRCDCGRWLSRDVKITQVIAADSGHIQFERGDSLLKRAANINMGIITRCGEKTTLNKGSYVLTAPNFGCTPESCTPTYRWEVQRVGDSQTIIGTGQAFPYQFVQDGIYNIKIIPICGGRECEPCQIQIRIGRIIGTVHPDIAIDRDVRGL